MQCKLFFFGDQFLSNADFFDKLFFSHLNCVMAENALSHTHMLVSTDSISNAKFFSLNYLLLLTIFQNSFMSLKFIYGQQK